MNKSELENAYKGKQLKIIDMKDTPSYNGKVGTCTNVDDIGQLHGTWGGCAIIPEEDKFEVVAESEDLEETRKARKWTEADFKTPAGKLAKKIIDLLIKQEMWIDTFIYIDGKRIGCYDGEHYRYDNTWDCVFVEENINPKDYLSYASDFMNISTEGPLYDIINYGNYDNSATLKEFDKILKDAGKYYDMGDAWYFGIYDL